MVTEEARKNGGKKTYTSVAEFNRGSSRPIERVLAKSGDHEIVYTA